MTRRTILSAMFAAAVAGAAASASGTAVVEILRHGHFYAAPATLYLTVAVEPNADNRMLRVVADGDALYRASEVVLNGLESQRLHTMSFRSLPAGTYTLRAEVASATAVRGVAEDQIVVTEGAGR